MSKAIPPIENQESVIKGASLVVASGFAFALVGLLIKQLSDNLNTEVIFFWRNLFGVGILLPWLIRNGLAAARTHCFPLHMVRSVAGMAATFCYFFALGRIPLADAVLLNFTAPLFVPLFALLWIGERPITKIALALAIGFAGTVLILKPGTALFSPHALIGLMAGVLGGLAVVAIARMAATEPATRIVFYYTVTGLILSTLPLPWRWQTPSLDELLLLLAIGALATLAHWLFTRGCVIAPVRNVNPLMYTSVVFAALFGWVFYDEGLGIYTQLGILLVCLGGTLAIRSKYYAA